jgi:hypothetical protein
MPNLPPDAIGANGLQQDIDYFQSKLFDVFNIPRRFLGFSDEELAANSEYQLHLQRRTERAERYERFIDTLMSGQPLPLPTGVIHYMDIKYPIEKPLSGGFVFKLKRLNLGLSDVRL